MSSEEASHSHDHNHHSHHPVSGKGVVSSPSSTASIRPMRKAVPAFYDDSCSSSADRSRNPPTNNSNTVSLATTSGTSVSSINNNNKSSSSGGKGTGASSLNNPATRRDRKGGGAHSSEEDSVAEMMDYQSDDNISSSGADNTGRRQQKRRRINNAMKNNNDVTSPAKQTRNSLFATTSTAAGAITQSNSANKNISIKSKGQGPTNKLFSSVLRNNNNMSVANNNKNTVENSSHVGPLPSPGLTMLTNSAFESPKNRGGGSITHHTSHHHHHHHHHHSNTTATSSVIQPQHHTNPQLQSTQDHDALQQLQSKQSSLHKFTNQTAAQTNVRARNIDNNSTMPNRANLSTAQPQTNTSALSITNTSTSGVGLLFPKTSRTSSVSGAHSPALSVDGIIGEIMPNEGADREDPTIHWPCSLPKFRDPQTCMWTASHAANCPSEDRSASLVNVLLQPLPRNFDSETQLPPLPEIPKYPTLIRLNLWSVIDGHGGGCVATYASEVLLPHIAASVSRALGCAIVDRGVCIVNGQLRDANALDLDGLIQVTSDQSNAGFSSNPNSIRYRSPYERSDSEDENDLPTGDNTNNDTNIPHTAEGSAADHPNEEPSEPAEESQQRSPPQLASLEEASPASLSSSPSQDQCRHGLSGGAAAKAVEATTTTSNASRSVAAGSSQSSNFSRSHSTPRKPLAPPSTASSTPSTSSLAPVETGVINDDSAESPPAKKAARAGEEDTASLVLGTTAEDASVSSVKTSVKTAASLAKKNLVGTHSPREVAAITRAITESFLAVDEGWINSIDPIATHQTSCQSNGRWNSGACALVVFTIQRMDWTSVSEPDRERESRGLEKSKRNTSQNRDAARRRMLDYAARTKSASSMSTVSSTSSLTTEEAVHASGLESEITETEGEDDEFGIHPLDYYEGGGIARRRNPAGTRVAAGHRNHHHVHHNESLISPPGGCSCHCYRAHDAILYTAHVGDCRAVMLGCAPPRTIKVRGGANNAHPNPVGDNDITTDDEESSHHSSDETECLSSSDHDADSSEDDDYNTAEEAVVSRALHASKKPTDGTSTLPSSSSVATTAPTTVGTTTTATSSTAKSYRMIPRRVVRQRGSGVSPRKASNDDFSGPFRPLPPLIVHHAPPQQQHVSLVDNYESLDTIDGFVPVPHARRTTADNNSTSSTQSSRNDESSSDGNDQLPLVHLPPVTRPIDLTTDHSAYNPAEVVAVLRRCNNAPRAISAGLGGGIKRVAGSLAVTRALGDAYLKTPLLSFNPYKSHAPYITARPEVNCRPLVKDLDKVLILATDGVWERTSGEDVLRWVRNFYEERVAEAERRNNRRQNNNSNTMPINEDCNNAEGSTQKCFAEGADRDLFEIIARVPHDGPALNNVDTSITATSRKRGATSPPVVGNKRRKRTGRMSYNVADVIVRRVLNKVRRARNISSLQALMSLPLGRARRSKHDDITSSVVDLSEFVM